jgi:hypothetical protein
MAMTKIEKEVTDLILFGKVPLGSKEEEEDVAINILKVSAEKYPDILWSVIFEAFSYEHTGMTISAMAAYLCSPSAKNHFNSKTKRYFTDILLTLNPIALLDLTEHVKSKIFGSGLGARNQKLLRNVIERWSYDELKEYASLYPKELLSLVKLLHPRLSDDKGKIIQNIGNKLV